MTDDTDLQSEAILELGQALALGAEARAFFNTDLGRTLVDRADGENKELVQKFVDCDPADTAPEHVLLLPLLAFFTSDSTMPAAGEQLEEPHCRSCVPPPAPHSRSSNSSVPHTVHLVPRHTPATGWLLLLLLLLLLVLLLLLLLLLLRT